MHKAESPETWSPARSAPKKRVAIVGARGYSGAELARILLKHPGVELGACFVGHEPFVLSDLLPEPAARRVPMLPASDLVNAGPRFDVIFLATPAEFSLVTAPALLAGGVSVIDLSGAFRLKGQSPADAKALYRQWYAFEHSSPEGLEKAVYGLAPWSHRGPAPTAPALIANPGCYATAALMGVLPLLAANLVDPDSIVIDAKSGTSGAGRKAAESMLFNEVDGDCQPYKIAKHQHLPEIREHARILAGTVIDPFFATSLLPVRRGIIANIHARLRPGKSPADVQGAFERAYSAYGLVDHGPVSGASSLSLKRVAGSPRTMLRYEVSGDKLYLFSLIDNLLKGAASQAVENLNWLNEWPVDLGLTGTEGTL